MYRGVHSNFNHGGGIKLVEKRVILASVAGKIPLQGANVFMHIFSKKRSFFPIILCIMESERVEM